MNENERKISENQWNFGVFGKTGRAQGGQPLAHSLYAAVAIPASTSTRFAFPDINSYNLSICSDITSQDWLLILKVVRAVARSRGRAVRGAF
jgi:hypothetical protein